MIDCVARVGPWINEAPQLTASIGQHLRRLVISIKLMLRHANHETKPCGSWVLVPVQSCLCTCICYSQALRELVHHEIWEYCQSTSTVQAQVLQNLKVRWALCGCVSVEIVSQHILANIAQGIGALDLASDLQQEGSSAFIHPCPKRMVCSCPGHLSSDPSCCF